MLNCIESSTIFFVVYLLTKVTLLKTKKILYIVGIMLHYSRNDMFSLYI